MSEDKKHYSDEPLTTKELQKIRAVLDKEEKWKWLAVTMRNIAVYVAGIVAAVVLLWDNFVKIIRGVV